ncbi:hypothetical protein [Desulforamulus reducens]|uniref:hypothetical protein n=1 Tax=Desulforamulus reducens TaxID=59610 RepID=UPI00031BE679|nr:hypothetical protein [Desulforamulus reducens]
MLSNLKLLMELQMYREDAEKLAEIFHFHQDKLLKLKEKYPHWKSYLKPEVLASLRQKGLPID